MVVISAFLVLTFGGGGGKVKVQSCNMLVPVRYHQWGLVCR